MKRVKRAHGLLPCAPEKGEHITVHYGRAAVQAHVRKVKHGRDISWAALYTGTPPGSLSLPPQRLSGFVRRKDEGTTWVRGWDTPAANAFKVVVALS